MTQAEIVTDGLRKFIRLTALRSDPLQTKWVRDELDLIDTLEYVKELFQQSVRMKGNKMYKGQDYDAVEDVKRDMEEILFTGREQHENAGLRRKNITMYHLVICPVIDSFKGMSHEQILTSVGVVIDSVAAELSTLDVTSHYDDALVAKAQVNQMVREREAKRKMELHRKRKVRRRKKDPLIALFDLEKAEIQMNF